MKNIKTKLFVLLAATSFVTMVNASDRGMFSLGGPPVVQMIQISNMLANLELQDPGMSQTNVRVYFYNGGKKECWSDRVDYQTPYTFLAGVGLGCATQATQIVVQPIPNGGKVTAYKGPYSINLDKSRFSTQLILVQDQPPVFDKQTGLVKEQGTMKAKMQSQLQ